MPRPGFRTCIASSRRTPSFQRLAAIRLISTILMRGPLPMPVSAVRYTMPRSGIEFHLPSSLDDERRAIASWLSSLNFQASQNEFIQKRGEGTGEWFLKSQEFKDWRDGTSEMLWCPGDGKIIVSLNCTSSLAAE